jgi:hypothetical protein
MYFGTSDFVPCREVFILYPYFGESTIGGSTVLGMAVYLYAAGHSYSEEIDSLCFSWFKILSSLLLSFLHCVFVRD